MSININKLKLRRGRRGGGGGGQTSFVLRNSGDVTMDEDTAEQFISFSANKEIAALDIISGSGGTLVDTALYLTDYTTPGVFNFTVRATSVEQQFSFNSVQFTINDIADPPDPETQLAAPTGLTELFSNRFSIRVGMTPPVGTVSLQYMLNGPETTWLNFGGAAVGPWWCSGLVPGQTYRVKVRAISATGLAGIESSEVQMTTDEEVDPPPDPNGVTPVRARLLSESVMMHLYLTRAGGDPHTAYRTGNSATSGAYQTSGWLYGHYKPLADIGVGIRYRSACGYGGGVTHQVPTIMQKMFDDWGARMHATLTMFTTAQRATAGDTSGVSSETAIQKLYDHVRECVASFQGINEPNNPTKEYYNNGPKYPGGWRPLVIDHTIVNSNKINSLTQWPADMTYGSFSIWSRKLVEIRNLIYANYVHNIQYAGGEMLFDIFNPYTTPSGRQWIRDCLPRLDWINLHLYTGGWRPDQAGDTGGNVQDENGSETDAIALESTLDQYSELANGNASFEVKCTEFGYERGAVNATRPGYSLRDLTDTARAKFYQRWNFDLWERFNQVSEGVWFEFMDNASQIPGPGKDGKVYGMLRWTQQGANNYTFIRMLPWYICYLTYLPVVDNAPTAKTFTVSDLAYTLGDAGTPGQFTNEIKHKLFQTSNGKHLLAVWFNHQSWNRDTFANNFASRNIRLTLTATTKIMRKTRPYTDAVAESMTNTWTTINGGVATNTHDFTVHDDVMWIEMT